MSLGTTSLRPAGLRAALAAWTGAGATENARRSLDEWTRAQDEVAARLALMGRDDHRRAAGRPTHRSA